MSTFVLCVGCGTPLYGFSPCQWCTCELCGNDLRDEFCSLCNLRNSCVYDPNPNSFDCPPDSCHPSHPTYETYSCDSYRNDSHFVYDCQPQFPFNYESEPGYIENYNSYPYDSSSFPQQELCCEDCGGLPEADHCQPPQYTVNHPIFNAYNDLLNANSDLLNSQNKITIAQNKLMEQLTSICAMHHDNAESTHDSSLIISSKIDSLLDEFAGELTLLKSIPPGIDETDCHLENEIRFFERLLYDNSSPRPPKEFVSENSNADIESFSPSPIPVEDKDSPCCDDDDDEERSNSLKDNIIFRLPLYFAITPNEPVDPLSMGDEHLNTILATESDEFIKSSVENLVPNPSESEGESGCDVPSCFTTFLNVLFDAEYEFDSSDDQSLSDEVVPEKIFSNPLFEEEIISMKINPHHFNAEPDLIECLLNRDSSIIPSSSKIDSLLDEFTGKLTLLKSIPSGIDETDCDPEDEIRFTRRLLYDNSSPRPPKECDDPMPPSIEEDDDDSERDILIHEELLDNYSLSLPVNKSFHFDIPLFSRPPAKPPDGNIGILNIKMMGDNSEQKAPMPKHMNTLVSNQEKSPDLLSHRSLEFF
nr:hypothetical protein [Tanacetum cinerariifolium]